MFKLRKILSILVSIVLSFVLVTQSLELKVSAATLGMSVTAYSSYYLVNNNDFTPTQIESIQTAGNLSGKNPTGNCRYVCGWFNYQLTADYSGWYELILTINEYVACEYPKTQFILDGSTYLNPFYKKLNQNTLKIGNVWLTAGNHTFKIQKYVGSGLGAYKSFEFKPVATNLARNIRVGQDSDTPYGANGGGLFLKTNETFNLNVYSAGSATGAFAMEVYNKVTNALYKTYTVNVTSSTNEVKHTVAVGCADAGTYYIKYKAAGVYVALTEGLLDEEFTVMDATPVDVTGSLLEATKVLVGSEINCATTTPDYVAGNVDSEFGYQTRVVTASYGNYLETGNSGYLTSKINPNYVAFKMPVLYPDKHYVAEIDYPDDAERSFAIVMRQEGELYGVAGGIDSGYEYPITNTTKKFTFDFYMIKQGQPRIGVMTNQTGLRAAITKIRIYEVTSIPYLKASSSGRDAGYFIEEGINFISMYGAKDESVAEAMKAGERWAQSTRYMGGNVLFPAASIYQQSLSPSVNYDIVHSDLHTPDYFKMLLIYAEKYGLSVVADCHRNKSELSFDSKGTSNYQKNWAMDKDGNYPSSCIFNPIYPANQTWMDGYITEFANRYKNFSSFKGMSIRSSYWENTGFTNFNNINYGYDDYTAGQFCNFLGITDPGTPSTRYSTFTNSTYKQKWIDWRVSQINAVLQGYTDTLKAVRSNLVLFSLVNCFAANTTKKNSVVQVLTEAGIKDNKIDGFQWIYGEYAYGRKSLDTDLTNSRYAWNNSKALLTDDDNLSFFPNSTNYCLAANYIEDGGLCMNPEDLGLPLDTAWISAHVVPPGRNNLERYALALAKTDTQLIFNGGNAYVYDQPIVREFMQEYRQLPKAKFNLINTVDNDVVVRDYVGTDYYFYVVNQTNSFKTCQIDFGQAQTITRLSTGISTNATNNKITISLDAYEVKVFKSQGAKIIDVDGVKPSLIGANSIRDNFEDVPTSNALWETKTAVASPSTQMNDFSVDNANGNSYLKPVYQRYAPYQSYITTIQDNSWNKNKLQVFETKVLLPAIANNTYADIASNIFLYQDPITKENVRFGFTKWSGALTGKVYSSSGITVVNGTNYSTERLGYPISGFNSANWMTVKAQYDYSVANTITISLTFTNGSTVSTCSMSFSPNAGTLASSFKVGFGSHSMARPNDITYYDDVNLQFEESITDNFDNANVSNALWDTKTAVISPNTKINDFSINSASGNYYLKPAYQQYTPNQSYITTIQDNLWNKNKLQVFETKVLLPAIANNTYVEVASNIFLYHDPVTKENVRFGFTKWSGALTGKAYSSSGITVVNGTNYSTQRLGYPISGFNLANWMTVKAQYDYSVANTITILLTFTNGSTVSTCSMSFSPNAGTLASSFKVGFGSHSWNQPNDITYYDDVNLQFEKSMTDNFNNENVSNALWETKTAVASPSTQMNDFSVDNANGNSYLKPVYQRYAPYQSYITTIQDNSWNKNKLQVFETKVLLPAIANNTYADIASNIFLYQDPITKENVRFGFTKWSGALTGKVYSSSGITVVNGTNYSTQRLGYPISGFNSANWMTVKAQYDYSVANTITISLTFTNGSTVSTCSMSFSPNVGTLASSFKVGFGSHSMAQPNDITYYDDVSFKFSD